MSSRQEAASSRQSAVGSRQAPPAERSLRSGVGGVGGGWCPPTAGMPEACLLPQLLLTDDLAESGAQQLAVGLVCVRPARVSTMGPHQRFTQGAVVGNHPLPASPTSFHSVGEEPCSRRSAVGKKRVVRVFPGKRGSRRARPSAEAVRDLSSGGSSHFSAPDFPALIKSAEK